MFHFVFRWTLIARITDQIQHNDGEDQNEHAEEVNQVTLMFHFFIRINFSTEKSNSIDEATS